MYLFNILTSLKTTIRLLYTDILRAHLHETQSELKPAWNLKPLWKIVPFTLRFHCGNFRKHNKILMHMGKRKLLINASLINSKTDVALMVVFSITVATHTCASVIS